MFDLTGKVAVITGSSRGIGRAIAEMYAKAGAKVVVSSRTAEACEPVAEAIRADGGEALVVPCNVSRREEVEGLVEKTLAEWGQIDVLVCNAAINPVYGPLSNLDDEAFAKIMTANVLSPLQLCNLVLPGMAKRGGGNVVILSSISGLTGNAVIGAYGISKAADASLARNLAVEWGPKGIRVNAIAPGLIKTDFARALWENPEYLAKVEQQNPLRRIGQPDDIAGTALFLATDASAYITGQTIVADGGETIC